MSACKSRHYFYENYIDNNLVKCVHVIMYIPKLNIFRRQESFNY
jgi:hypothetical protein